MELHGLSIDDQASNPFFVDETGGDYHLRSDSPVKGLGQPLPLDVATALGVTAGVPVDMGAYPFPLSPPTNLSATAIPPSEINLTWTASIDNVGVTGYTVFRDGTQIATTTTTTYSDNGLTAGITYTYTVAAYDAAGNTSAHSASASATTPSTDLTVTITAPTDEQMVSGTITIGASVSSNVTGVNFYVDGVYVGNDGANGGTATTSWDTTTVAKGKHTISAKAFAGGVTATTAIAVNVN
jgi:hypothetical protein